MSSGPSDSSQQHPLNLHTSLQLNLSRFTIAYRVTETAWLSAFDGMAWQSSFEEMLRQSVCFSKCEGVGVCEFKNRCLYQKLFVQQEETRTDHAPPYTLSPQSGMRAKKWHPGDHFYVGLTMVGRAAFFLDAFLPAIEAMGRVPLGSSGGRVMLATITQHLQSGHDVVLYEKGEMQPPHPPEQVPCPAAPDEICVNLETPLRLRGEKGVVRIPTFDGPLFGSALEQRLLDLHLLEGLRPNHGSFDWPKAQNVYLRWLPSKQPSRRGVNWSPLNTAGLVGSFTLGGPRLREIWPLLWQGQFINLGEEAHVGLGRYSLSMV